MKFKRMEIAEKRIDWGSEQWFTRLFSDESFRSRKHLVWSPAGRAVEQEPKQFWMAGDEAKKI